MDETDLRPLLSNLSDDITSLTTALRPLLDAPLPTISTKLPLLDKAKLQVLTTYAIESLLFSSLRLSGVDAKQHPIFRELARTRQYFEKVKLAEEGEQKRTFEVDKAAAGRFIKHGLAGNDKLDRENVAEQARRISSAKRKFAELNSEQRQDNVDATMDDVEAQEGSSTVNTESPEKSGRRSSKRSKKKAKKSDKQPKSGHEVFQALAKGGKGGG